jgi:prepilin peptidase CpaA
MSIVVSLSLLVILIIATVIDVRRQSIPNWLTFGGMVLGVIAQTVVNGRLGLEQSVLGLFIATGIAGVVWIPRMIGGGDHKLLMAIGAFVGSSLIIPVLLYTAIVGGVQALVWVAIAKYRHADQPWSGLFRATRMPYSIAIAMGTCISFILPRVIY